MGRTTVRQCSAALGLASLLLPATACAQSVEHDLDLSVEGIVLSVQNLKFMGADPWERQSLTPIGYFSGLRLGLNHGLSEHWLLGGQLLAETWQHDAGTVDPSTHSILGSLGPRLEYVGDPKPGTRARPFLALDLNFYAGVIAASAIDKVVWYYGQMGPTMGFHFWTSDTLSFDPALSVLFDVGKTTRTIPFVTDSGPNGSGTDYGYFTLGATVLLTMGVSFRLQP